MRYRLSAIAALAVLFVTGLAMAGEVVRIENASRPTRCAEEDNVYVKLIGAGITRLRVEARHPAYLQDLREDRTAPDFSDCDVWHDPSYAFEPRDVVLFENADYLLMGHSFKSFWRPESVEFRVGGEVTRGLHLVQLIRKTEGRRIEILVLYPSDGYWRAKPLPPAGTADTAYGSSFLIGPIEEERRPFVALSSIEFVPSALLFRLRFRQGEGSLRVAEASSERTSLDITLPPIGEGSAFAALRSMFVSTAVADTAEVMVSADGRDRRIGSILDFTTAEAQAVTFARSAASRHNTSAPDLRFSDFER